MTDPNFVPVSRSSPCQVCGKYDWCLISRDKATAICPRVESNRRAGDAGWIHRLRDEYDACRVRRLTIPATAPQADLGGLADRCHRAVTSDRLAGLARSLGVTAESLAALGVGWSADSVAWTFPMADPESGRVVGIRLRTRDGSKFAVKGGRDGLFLPVTPTGPGDPLLIAEGPTDTAALLDLGYPGAVGRPSCAGGIKQLVTLVRAGRQEDVVIVADGDPVGRRGAENLATVMVCYAGRVRVIAPPNGVKDVREWKHAGATREDVEELIQAAPARQLAVRVREVRRGV